MAQYYEHQQILDNDLIEEQVKQIALNVFYSFYVRRNLEDTLTHFSDNVSFIGSKDYFVAHSKEEMGSLLGKELKEIPYDCVLKVIQASTTTVSPGCYSVMGELELRLPLFKKISYSSLRFSMMIMKAEETYTIVSVHTSVNEDEVVDTGSEQEEEKALLHMAEDASNHEGYDDVTGLLTLDLFKKQAREIFDKERDMVQYALICTDINHFERVNNIYGLKHADYTLVELASLLTTCSKTVRLCCRSVADHFIVLVTYSDIERLKLLLKKLCEQFDTNMGESCPEALPRLGLGVYLVQDIKEDVGKMVERANIARRNLRLQKKTRISFYDAKVYQRMEKIKQIEKSMRKALEDNEFKVYIQPKYHLDTGRIVGAEALVRWIRRDGSMVYPDEFIPIFEKNGFIVELDFFMLDGVCQMISRRLGRKKKCVPISINQSRVLLRDKDYVSKVASVLAKNNTPPLYVELELTERILGSNLSDIANMMSKLKDLGIRWSIDDFGTGYSSLNLLKELPVDIIKIDKSFLDETEKSETSKIIIRKTVELTRELDKMVVCEGVETETQAAYLRNIRCDIAQGYLYARPMPMEEFEQLLDKELK